MNKKINAFIFDLDGTLAQSLDVMQNAYEEFVRFLGGNPTLEEFNSLNGPTLDQIVCRLKATYNSAKNEKELLSRYLVIIESQYSSVKPTLGSIEILNFASQNQIKMCLVTSNSRVVAEKWLLANQFDHFFSEIVGFEDVKHGKPSPEPYLTALTKLSASPEQAVVFEDSKQGYESARLAQISTVLIADKPLEWADKQKVLIFQNFSEIDYNKFIEKQYPQLADDQ